MRGMIVMGLTVALATGAHAAALPEKGSGPYSALAKTRADLLDHVVYRPATLSGLGDQKLGIYVYGNGGCSDDGTASRNHRLDIASHSYLVIAHGHIPDGAKRDRPVAAAKLTAQTPTRALSEAIDWAQREVGQPASPFYGHVAADQVAVSGWSCGGLQARIAVSAATRV